MATITLKEPTGATAGGSEKWGGPDAVHCAQILKGTHSGGELIQASDVETTNSNVQADIDLMVTATSVNEFTGKTYNVDVITNFLVQTTPAAGEYLRDNGGKFVGSAILLADLPAIASTDLSDGGTLVQTSDTNTFTALQTMNAGIDMGGNQIIGAPAAQTLDAEFISKKHYDDTSLTVAGASAALQVLRRNAANTAYEFALMTTGDLTDVDNIALLDETNVFTHQTQTVQADAGITVTLDSAAAAATGAVLAMKAARGTIASPADYLQTNVFFTLSGDYYHTGAYRQSFLFDIQTSHSASAGSDYSCVGTMQSIRSGETTLSDRFGWNNDGDLDFHDNSIVNSSLNSGQIPFIIDGGGSAISTGIKGDVEIPYNCLITSVRMFADVSTTCVVDLWADSYANYPPTDADSLTASAVPTITAALKSEDTTLTGWTTTLSKGDIVRFNVDSNDNATRLTVALQLERT